MALSSDDIMQLAAVGINSAEQLAEVARLIERYGNALQSVTDSVTERYMRKKEQGTARVRKFRLAKKIKAVSEVIAPAASDLEEALQSVTEALQPNLVSFPTPLPSLLPEPLPTVSITTEGSKKMNARAGAREMSTRLPADFTPNDADELVARQLAFSQRNWDECLAEFRDYWAGVPGTKGKKLDWHATFRNSIRRYRKGRTNGTHQQKPSNLDNLRTAFDAIDARLAGEGELREKGNA